MQRLAALVARLRKRGDSPDPPGAPASSQAATSPEPPTPSTPPGEEPFGTGYT